MEPLRVGVLAYPGCFASEIFGLLDLLTVAGHVAARRDGPGPAYETAVLSSRRRVVASGGCVLDVRAPRAVDVLVVPGFEHPAGADPDAVLAGLRPELAAIRERHDDGAAVVSVCLGAFLLAEVGLLDGRAATTSWLFADRLADRYPAIDVRADEMVVTDRGVTTAAAFSAVHDVALGIIRRRSGDEVTRRTARIALVDDARSSQAPYVDPALLPRRDPGFSGAVKRHLDRDLAAPYDLRGLAAAHHVSSRTLLRRFRVEAGRTPLDYLQSARVDRARHLLETTDRTIAHVAAAVGYRDAGAFGAVFTRHTGCRPSDYRSAFRRRGTGEAG